MPGVRPVSSSNWCNDGMVHAACYNVTTPMMQAEPCWMRVQVQKINAGSYEKPGHPNCKQTSFAVGAQKCLSLQHLQVAVSPKAPMQLCYPTRRLPPTMQGTAKVNRQSSPQTQWRPATLDASTPLPSRHGPLDRCLGPSSAAAPQSSCPPEAGWTAGGQAAGPLRNQGLAAVRWLHLPCHYLDMQVLMRMKALQT